jgi:hypothetical protein
LFSPEGVSPFFPDRVRGFLSFNRAGVLTGQASGIGYSPCVGRSGIPTVEEPNKTAIQNARQIRPGGLRVLGPRPLLRDFTKEMDLILSWRRLRVCSA